MPNSNSEKVFRSYLESTKRESFRLFCALGALLFLSFTVADYYSFSSTLSEVLFIRGGVVVTLMLAFFLSTKKTFIKHYEVLMVFVFFVGAGGIEAMIYLAQPEDYASKVYFVGVLLVIMALFGWSFLSIFTTSIILVSIIAGYIWISFAKGALLPELLVNLFFLMAAIGVGITSQMLRGHFLKEIFLLKESLAKALENKTVESKNHAFLANHDALTGLPNRRYVITLLEESLNVAKNYDKIFSIFFIDLNGFKQINDTHGHAFGDEVLKITAKRLKFVTGIDDCLSRLGGDEFLIGIILDKRNQSNFDSIIGRYVKAISRPMKVFDKTLSVSASVGVASYPAQGDSIEVLMNIADEKMYESKHQKKQASDPRDNLGATLTVVKN